jgi:glycine hydroxymethyltransferase
VITVSIKTTVHRLPGPATADPGPAALAATAAAELSEQDPELYRLLADDLRARTTTLDLVAATSIAPPSVLGCAGSALSDIIADGYPDARLHAGCTVVDEVERLAVERAKVVFHASDANVQPYSGSAANLAVYFGLLEPGDPILGLDVDSGGHPTHGALTSVIGRYFTPVSYGLDTAGRIDYDRVRDLAHRFHPKIVVCGGPAYPRIPDFATFRQIADEVGAFLLADISAVAGLVAAGEHPNPIDHAHVTTASTRAQLCGPRGGLILLGADADSPVPGTHTTLRRQLRRAVYPHRTDHPRPGHDRRDSPRTVLCVHSGVPPTGHVDHHQRPCHGGPPGGAGPRHPDRRHRQPPGIAERHVVRHDGIRRRAGPGVVRNPGQPHQNPVGRQATPDSQRHPTRHRRPCPARPGVTRRTPLC